MPPGSATVSSARTTVVPTAITRPPSALALATTRAVTGGTAKRSGYGRSCASGDATPVCSSTGTTSTPAVTSRVTSADVNGRPALGISALPGCTPNTVW